MKTAIRVEVLPARMGDCLIIECPRTDGTTWRMLVDGGPPDTWPTLESRLGLLAPGDRIDVAVVTHIDSDHIGGMLSFIRSAFAGRVDDYWFNGRTHLPDAPKRSVAQGASLTAALLDAGEDATSYPWNVAFGGGPIDTGPERGFIEVAYDGGRRVTVVSPTTKRLTGLAAKWRETVERAKRQTTHSPDPDWPPPLKDLEDLAAEPTTKDASVANGSSIALLVEHRGASVVLGADAFGDVLATGLLGVAASRGLETVPVDAFKLPHHGSRNNVTAGLLKVAPARHYLVSSNGDTFHHPDDVALARVVLHSPPGRKLWFNYRTPRNERWDDPDLIERYGYQFRLPEATETGSVLALETRQ